jgi:hypothetical protein
LATQDVSTAGLDSAIHHRESSMVGVVAREANPQIDRENRRCADVKTRLGMARGGLLVAVCCIAVVLGACGASTPNVPHSKKAADLATEVYRSLASSYFNFLSSDIAGFDAVFTMEKDRKPLGNMSVSWNRGDEKVAAVLEGKVEGETKSAAEGLVGGHAVSILVWGPFKSAVGSGSGVYAVRSGNEYVMDASEKSSNKHPEIESHRLFASADFSRLRNLLIRKDGTVLDMAYYAESANGGRFISSTSTTGRSQGKTAWRVDITFTYTHTEGTVFLKRVVTKRVAGNKTTTWTALLESVAFRKGAAGGVPEKESPGSKSPDEDTLRDRFWGQM